LIADILVGAYQHLKTSPLGCRKQFAIGQAVPTSFSAFGYGVAQKRSSGSSWSAIVQQNEHLTVPDRRGVKTSCREFKHSLDLLASDRKLLNDFIDRHPVLKVF
jgi:hypothetical protein